MAGFLSKKQYAPGAAIRFTMQSWMDLTRMLDITDTLQLVVNRFNNRSFSQQDTIIEGHEAIFHVTSNTGHEVNPLSFENSL
jgi:hypothetical protein